MKKSVARIFSVALCIALCGAFCIFSSALSTNEYGLGLTAASHEADGNATVKLTLENSNSFDVDNISINHSVPDGLSFSGSADTFGIEKLAAGEIYECQLAFSATGAAAPQTAQVSEEKSVDAAAVAAVAAAAVLICVAVLLIKKRRKAVAMLLAVLMLLPVAGIFGVNAVGAPELRTFTLEDSVSLGGKTYPLSITVSYEASTAKNSYFELETDTQTAEGESKTVNRPVADFSGKAVASSSVESVRYEVRSDVDGFEVGSSGKAVLDGCNWNADDISLKHGDNVVTFTATLADGSTQTYTQEVYYDSGDIYQRSKSEEVKEGNTEYVRNIINIYFEIDTTDKRIDEILADFGAERVGEVNDIVMVQARFKAENLEQLNRICARLEEYEEVVGAGVEQILPLEVNVTTDDPWYPYTSHSETINEDLPGGYNWHAEAVQAYSTWDYDEFFSTAKVGIIDGPVMTTHEDMQGVISFNGSYASHNTLSDNPATLKGQYHGTHVASLIGATPNNGIGLSGLLWDVDIYAANFQSSAASSGTLGYVVSAVSSHVTNGAKAVNLSLGLTNTPATDYNPYENPYSIEQLDSTAKQCAIGMNTLINAGKEFVVVQSAGNGVIDTRVGSQSYRSVDATQNGLYCSIRRNTRYGSLTYAQTNAVFDRVIVVGAATNKSNNANGLAFEMTYFSNAGDRVDIYAPGYSIFGATTPQPDSDDNYTIMYGRLSGTSQAAPQVAAVAALCFAINPDFTGAQVKNLISAEENTRCVVYDYSQMQTGLDGNTYDVHPIEGNGRMLSMKLVTEAALRTVCGRANYTALNRAVAIAQSIDPSTVSNYEIVQTVLDSIDYNLYAYEQDKVDAKYLELLDAIDKLVELVPADYTAVESAKAEAAALNPDDYVDFSGVTNAVNAVVYGKYSDEQAAVDQMAQDILDAIAALLPNASINTADSNVVADNDNRYIVFTADYIEYYFDALEATGGYTVTREANSSGTYSTGSTVTLSKEGSTDVTYVVAVLGDIDGNGKADANDAFLARMYAIGLIEQTADVYTVAADANCDGTVTEDDSVLIQNSAIFEDAIFNDYTAGE